MLNSDVTNQRVNNYMAKCIEELKLRKRFSKNYFH